MISFVIRRHTFRVKRANALKSKIQQTDKNKTNLQTLELNTNISFITESKCKIMNSNGICSTNICFFSFCSLRFHAHNTYRQTLCNILLYKNHFKAIDENDREPQPLETCEQRTKHTKKKIHKNCHT